MENNPLYPFERNRYYPGKLLTATDFQAEQNYTNNKRRFMNQFLFGKGVVCGLSVFNLDDFSVMIESGVAVDGIGREIVVGSTVVKKLSTINGFSNLTTDRATLCLQYQEEEAQPVYAMQKQEVGQDLENNRICEGYSMCLVDTESLMASYAMESEFYSCGRLYQDETYTVDVIMPAVVSCGSLVKIMMRVKRHVGLGKDLRIHAMLQTPAFTGSDGQQQLEIQTGNIHLEVDEVYECEYWMTAQKQENNSATIIAKAENIRIVQGGQEKIAPTSFNLRSAIKSVSPSALITHEIGRMSLEMREMANTNQLIRLAEFHLVRTENSYVIDRVLDGEIKDYIALPAEERLRAEYSSFYRDATMYQMPQMVAQAHQSQPSASTPSKEPIYASGSCEIPLSVDAKAGMVFYSGEILHGLGRGDVQVDIGLYYLKHDKSLGTDGRCTIYGDAELFHKEEELPVIHGTTAVKVLNDKGCFVVAVKLLEDTSSAMAEMTWSAVKLPRADGLDYLDEKTNRSIVAETATVSLAPGESHFFNVRFKNMEQCSLKYTLTEENSGEISRDGVYTAPAKEGIYEIKIACAETPVICTYAYAVVKKKNDIA
ncbi:MAG: hypothetical protein R3Y62_00625 [Eubacteriales bacterium]